MEEKRIGDSTMFDKLKDILYDVSDILFSLIIVALIFSIVSWKISDSLAFEVKVPDKNTTEIASSSDPDLIQIEEATETEEDQTTPGTPNTDTTATPETTEPATPDTGSDAKPGGTSVNLVGTTKEIVIEPGSSGYSIGKLLADEGMVPDTQTFIKRVEELGLGAKLRSGTFTLSSDMSLDEVIYKISGQ
jgi:hypothetical protein